ncbi:MAG: DnaA/Hda family protein, partial [Bacillota bacterium]|nr:DnaA/Hda family protein [Bacillota bacterium]
MNWFKSDFNIRAWRLIEKYNLEKAPGVTLIYGSEGVGKSTMLRLLYQRIGVEKRGILTDSLSFARQYAYSAQENKLNMFRQRYRSARLLLIDDLQFLAGKVKTIEELHFTYEYIIGNGGKMVITLEANGPQLEFLGE